MTGQLNTCNFPHVKFDNVLNSLTYILISRLYGRKQRHAYIKLVKGI